MKDGVYCDAAWHHGIAGIGVVRVRGGQPESKFGCVTPAESCFAAEWIAAVMAIDLWGECRIFTDCQAVAQKMGIRHVNREDNRFAHHAARQAMRRADPAYNARCIEQNRKKKKKRWRHSKTAA